MSPEITDLLDRGVPGDVTEPDFTALARRGVRRRHTKRVGGVAMAAVLVLGAGAVIGGALRDDAPIIGEQPGGEAGWVEVPEGPLSPRTDTMTFVDGDRVLVWGGRGLPEGVDSVVDASGTAHLDVTLQDGAVYDASIDGWWTVPTSPLSPRWQPTIAFEGTVLVVYGGYAQEAVQGGGVTPSLDGELPQLTDGAVFDFETERWTLLPELPVDARRPAILDWRGHELLLWGGHDGDRALSDGAVWSEDAGWTPISDFPLEGRSGSFLALDDDRLVVWGGGIQVDSTGETLFADGAVYDRIADAWTVLPDAPLAPRWTSEPFPAGPTSLLRDDRVLIVGGARTTPDTEQYLDGAWLDLGDPSAIVWQPIPAAPSDARYAAAHPTGASAVGDDADDTRVWVYDLGVAVWREVDGVGGLADAPLDLGSTVVLSDTSGWTTATTGRYQPVLVSRDGRSRTPELYRDRQTRFWPAMARLDSGVFVWGGLEARLDAEGTYRGDGERVNTGFFLPLPR